MKSYKKLLALASWLENPDNEILNSVEDNDQVLNKVAESLVLAAEELRKGASELEQMEQGLAPSDLDEVAQLATAFDNSGDPDLLKIASVLDEILLTIGAPKDAVAQFKKAEEDKIEELKKKYNQTLDRQHQDSKVSEAVEAIEKSEAGKQYITLEAPLSTRTCPDHPGLQVERIGEDVWRCSLDNKVYNFRTGFTTLKGNKVPGGATENQSLLDKRTPSEMTFSTRESRMNK